MEKFVQMEMPTKERSTPPYTESGAKQSPSPQGEGRVESDAPLCKGGLGEFYLYLFRLQAEELVRFHRKICRREDFTC